MTTPEEFLREAATQRVQMVDLIVSARFRYARNSSMMVAHWAVALAYLVVACGSHHWWDWVIPVICFLNSGFWIACMRLNRKLIRDVTAMLRQNDESVRQLKRYL